MHTKLLFTALLISLSCSSCLFVQSGGPIPIGENFLIEVRGAAPVLHIPGNAQLRMSKGLRNIPIWYYLSGDAVATNGICLFNGGLTDGDEWQHEPALLAYRSPGPVVEITEILTHQYCLKNGTNYEANRSKYIYIWPQFTNGAFVVTQTNRHVKGEKSTYTRLTFSTTELNDIIELTKKTGVKRRYQGIDYRIADSINP
jgi:hypothetical protein